MDMSEFLEVFFEECSEGLDVMESGLLNLGTGEVDTEEINTIFRAAHSIKGGSATFDMLEIAGFTHVMETLLDQMRSHEREVTTPAVDLLLESVDCLREMIDATKDEVDIDEKRVNDLKKRLEVMLGNKDPEPAAEAPKAEESEGAAIYADEDSSRWEIEFFPTPEILKHGDEPYRLFDELRGLGELSVVCNLNKLPDFKSIDPTQVYLGWKLELITAATEDQIKSVFARLEDACEYKVTALDSVDDEEVSEPEPVVVETTSEVVASEPEAAAAEPEAKTEKTEAKAPDQPEVAAEEKSAPSQKAKKAKPTGEAGSIRVSIDKIDSLINLVGELIITQSMLSQFTDEFDMSQIESLRDGLGQLTRNSRELQETAMQIRMLPISSSFNRFPRLVRDMSSKLGKKVELKISGENTELDKTVLEKIADPLVHLVRNSMDHGLEMPDVRVEKGKPEMGTVHLSAFHEGGNIVIEVTDDGAGINKERVLKKAIENGIVGPEEKLTDDEINNLIFEPGFSTAEVVSDISGRGVGMDVVRRNINELGGQIYILSEEGRGSTISIRLPLTLAIIDGQLVKVGTEVYVIPMLSIDESLQVNPKLIKRYKGKIDLYKLREEYIPVLRLHKIFGLETEITNFEDGLLVVVEAERKRVGLFVDELQGQQQVVIKSLEKNYRKVESLSGATILGDGTVALIMDVASLIRQHLLSQGKLNIPSQEAA
jgi:two-component system chemotaxis sensor kinase CheA